MAGERIFIVEPVLATLDVCRMILEREGFVVVTACNAVAALSSKDLAECDMLLVDSHLDGMSALDLIRNVRESEASTYKPILLLVNESTITTYESVDSFGAQGWIMIPFDPGMLLKKIRIILESQQIMMQERELMRQQAVRMMKSVTEDALAKGIETHANNLLLKTKSRVDDQLRTLVETQLEGTSVELTAEKMEFIAKQVSRELAQKTLDELAMVIATQNVQKALNEQVVPAITKAVEESLPEATKREVVDQAERELPKMVQNSVQKAAEMIVPITSEKAVSIIEGVSQRLLPQLASNEVRKATEHYVTDTLQRQVPLIVGTQVGVEMNTALQERIMPVMKKTLSEVNIRLLLIFLIVLAICSLMLFYTIFRVEEIVQPVMQIRDMPSTGNPFEWLL